MEKARAIVLLSVFLALFSAIFAIGDTISSSMPTGLIAIPIDVDASELEQFFENGELKPEYVQQINENIDQIPPFVLETFAEGKTNVTFVTNENQELKFSVAVKDNQVISAKEGFEENADAEVKVDEKTIEKIAGSEEPVQELVAAVNSGEIEYKPTSASAGIRGIIFGIISFIVGIIMAVYSFLKSILGLK